MLTPKTVDYFSSVLPMEQCNHPFHTQTFAYLSHLHLLFQMIWTCMDRADTVEQHMLLLEK